LGLWAGAKRQFRDYAQNPNFRGQAIQELIFPAAKTDSEGGVDERGFFG
jgi:hypothetical protein